MSRKYNQITILGYLGNDPETRQTQSGKEITRFSVSLKGRDDKSEWISVVGFDKVGEIMKSYFTKGNYVFVAGSLSADSYTDKNGQARKSYGVIAQSVVNITPKDKITVPQENLDAGREHAALEELDDEIPF